MRLALLLIIGLWLGMLLGISFMEAPLKFKAPKMTMEIAIGLGQLVFRTLNKVEIVFSSLLIILLFITRKQLDLITITFLIIIVVVIIIQSLWFLPALDARATAVINGSLPQGPSYHTAYVLCEITKVVLLFISFIKLYPHE